MNQKATAEATETAPSQTPPDTAIPAPDGPAPATEEAFHEPDPHASDLTDLFSDDLEEGGFEVPKAETPAEETPLEETPPAEKVSDEAETQADVEIPEETPPAEEPPPEEPTEPAQEEVTPPPTAEQTQQVPPQPQLTPEQMREQYEAQRKATLAQLQKSYAMTPEDAERFEDSPAEVLPALAARLHLEITESLWRSATAQLPGLVNAVMQQTKQQSAGEEAFYKRWPRLKPYEDQVKQVAMMYRNLNPSTPFEQAIEEIGTHASVQLRLPIDGVTPPAQKPAGRASPPPPPTPAGPGAGGRPPTSQRPSEPPNPFAQLAEELLADDSS